MWRNIHRVIGILTLLVWSFGAQAQVPCLSLAVEFGGELESLNTMSCAEWQRSTMAVPENRLFRSFTATGFAHRDSTWFARVSQEAIRRAANIYKRLGQLPNIDLIFANISIGTARVEGAGVRPILAETVPKIFGDRCVIVINESVFQRGFEFGTTLGERELKLTIAHEMFHCVQYALWNQQMQMYSQGGAWWAEGSAEYFAYLVFPEYEIARHWVTDLDAAVPTLTLFEQTFTNTIFFAFLGGARGLGSPEAIGRLLGAMATAPGLAAQRTAMAAFPGVDELLQHYGEDYVNDNIFDPGGRRYGTSPRMEPPMEIVGEQEVRYRIRPWTIFGKLLTFQRGTDFRVKPKLLPARSKVRVSPNGTGKPWYDLPHDVTVCDGDQKLRVMPTSVSDSDELQDVVVKISEIREEGRGCPCPLGQWTIDRDELERYYFLIGTARKLSSTASTEESKMWNFSLRSGVPLLTFYRNGSSDFVADLTFMGPQHPRTGEQISARHLVTIDWLWRNRGGRLIRELKRIDGSNTLIFSGPRGRRSTLSPINRSAIPSETSQTFRCEGNNVLIVDGMASMMVSSDLASIMAQLAAGGSEQRRAAGAMRDSRGTERGSGVADAIGAIGTSPAYPMSGRFVRP